MAEHVAGSAIPNGLLMKGLDILEALCKLFWCSGHIVIYSGEKEDLGQVSQD